MIGVVSYLIFFLILSLIFAVSVLGLNLQWGFTGLFNAGVAGFTAVGAYIRFGISGGETSRVRVKVDKSLTVRHVGNYQPYAAVHSASCDQCVFTGLKADDNNWTGIGVFGSTGFTVRDCSTSGNGLQYERARLHC